MTGGVVHYKFCSVAFGQYCQISEEGHPRNGLGARTQGAIALGPSGNVQGGHKFYTLNTASVVVRRDWKALPMPQSVINRLNAKAKGQPSHPVFTDRSGNAIGDIPFDVGHIETDAMNSDHTLSDAMNSDYTNSNIEMGAINSDYTNSDVDLPGVHIGGRRI